MHMQRNEGIYNHEKVRVVKTNIDDESDWDDLFLHENMALK